MGSNIFGCFVKICNGSIYYGYETVYKVDVKGPKILLQLNVKNVKLSIILTPKIMNVGILILRFECQYSPNENTD